MPSTILGPVSMIPRGAYSASETYYKLNVVSYSGSSYVALDTVKGIPPTDATKWMILSEKGGAGDGSGDMLEADYRGSALGIVKNSDKLGGQEASYYAKALATDIATGTDLNAIRTPGKYKATSAVAATLGNIPVETSFGMEVTETGHTNPSVTQEVFTFSLGATTAKRYWRNYNGGSWGAWQEYLTTLGGDASNTTVTYTEPASKTEPVSGGKLSEIIGRLVKWIRSLTAADVGAASLSVTNTFTNNQYIGDTSNTAFLASRYRRLVEGINGIAAVGAGLGDGKPTATLIAYHDGTIVNRIDLSDTASDLMVPLSVASGGTDSTTAAEALKKLGGFPVGVTLEAGTDLNNVTAEGLYLASDADSATMLNTPTTRGFGLRVERTSPSRVVQHFTSFTSTDFSYERKSITTFASWTDWAVKLTSANPADTRLRLGIQSNYLAVTAEANGWTDVEVTFPVPYTSNPTVVLTPRRSQPTTTTLILKNRTTTGFTASVYNPDAAQSLGFEWVAVSRS